jgi:hypothetical protein
MTVLFQVREGRSGDSSRQDFQKRNYHSNRRFSLFNNILACHSERSEESPGPFTISLKFDLLVLSFHGREDVYKG